MIKFLVKLFISVLLLLWVLSKTDLLQVKEAFTQINFFYLLIAFSLHFVGVILTVWRWSISLKILGAPVRFGRLAQSFMVGQFFNTFLPSTIGGDFSRALDFKKELGGARSFAAVFMERFSGLVGLVLLATVALPFAQKVIPPGSSLPWMVLAILAFFLLFIVVVLLPQTSQLLGQESKLARFHAGLITYSKHPKPLAFVLALGLLLQLNVIVHYFFLSLGLGLHLPFLYFFIVIPILKVVLLFPFSINGIGLRENAFIYFFHVIGASTAAAVALSWLDLAMVLTLGSLGGLIYSLRK
jgi:uncharacterized protein (TIRG00374 family)